MVQHYISFRYNMFMHTLSTVLIMVFCVCCLGCCSLTLALSPHSLRPQPGMCPSVYLLSLSQPSLSIELTLQGVCVSPEPSFLTTLMIQLDPPIVCIRGLLLCVKPIPMCVSAYMCVCAAGCRITPMVSLCTWAWYSWFQVACPIMKSQLTNQM